MSKIIGIDLGNASIRAAVIEGGKPVMIPLDGAERMAGVIGRAQDGRLLFGDPADQMHKTDPTETVFSIRRAMDTGEKLKFEGREYQADAFVTELLRHVLACAEAYLGEKVRQAVLTVPNDYYQYQRRAIIKAAQQAGLELVRPMNATDAVMLGRYYNVPGNSRKVMICDMGDSAFNIGLYEIGDQIFECLCAAGDLLTGGCTLDSALAKHVAEQYRAERGVDLLADVLATERLRQAAREARFRLARQAEAQVFVPYIALANGAPAHLNVTITQKTCIALGSVGALNRVSALAERVLREGLGEKNLDALDGVLLTAGSAMFPGLKKALGEVTRGKPMQVAEVDGLAAMGAAIQGGWMAGDLESGVLLSVLPHSLGIETVGGVFTRLIERNTTIPVKQTQVFSTATDGLTSVSVKVLEGDSEKATENRIVSVKEIPVANPGPKGVPQIEVTFEILADGLLEVTSRELPIKAEESPPPPPPPPPPTPLSTLQSFVLAMLPTVDNLDMAIAATRRQVGGEAYAQGIQMTLDGMLASLRQMGVEEIAALGAAFDPMLHDAKAQTPGGKPGTIAEVYKRGFMMNGKVLRHAEVRVYRTE